MRYIFHDDNPIGEYPVEAFHICFYDGTAHCDGKCFDEFFVKPEDFDAKYLSYIETEEEKKEKGIDHSRIFVEMKNGERYELLLKSSSL